MKSLNLSKREKYAVGLAGCALGLFMVLELIIFPLVAHKEHLNRKCLVWKKEVEQIKLVKAEYDRIRRQAEERRNDSENLDSGFNLFSYLDHLAEQSGIKNNIRSMNPTTKDIPDQKIKLSIVDMKLNDLNLEQLVKFIYGIEYADKGIFVNRISISKRRLQVGAIDVILQVEVTMPS